MSAEGIIAAAAVVGMAVLVFLILRTGRGGG
jgi:hypothetical protein